MKASRQSVISRVKDFINRAAVPGRWDFSSQERAVGFILDPSIHWFCKEKRGSEIITGLEWHEYRFHPVHSYSEVIFPPKFLIWVWQNLICYILIPLVSRCTLKSCHVMKNHLNNQKMRNEITPGNLHSPAFTSILNDVSVHWRNQVLVPPPSPHLCEEQYLLTEEDDSEKAEFPKTVRIAVLVQL